MPLTLFGPVSHPEAGHWLVGSPESRRWASYLNAALGLWLFVSAFAWPHVLSSEMNTCLVGLFMGVSAVTATGWSIARGLTASLALWLAFTTIVVYPAGPATLWNNVLVAAAVLALCWVPYAVSGRRQTR